MYAFVVVLAIVIVRTTNAFFRLRLKLPLFPVTQQLMLGIRIFFNSSRVRRFPSHFMGGLSLLVNMGMLLHSLGATQQSRLKMAVLWFFLGRNGSIRV